MIPHNIVINITIIFMGFKVRGSKIDQMVTVNKFIVKIGVQIFVIFFLTVLSFFIFLNQKRNAKIPNINPAYNMDWLFVEFIFNSSPDIMSDIISIEKQKGIKKYFLA